MIRRTLIFVGSSLFCATLVFGANAEPSAKQGNAAKGKEVFEQCSVCHDVTTGEKKMGPSLKGLFKQKKLYNGEPVTEANVLKQINNGGGGMPAYKDMLSAQDKSNLLAYLKTL